MKNKIYIKAFIIIIILAAVIVAGIIYIKNDSKHKQKPEDTVDNTDEISKIFNSKLTPGEWRVTEHIDASGEQGMCYTIDDGTNLIIIDGGWADNAPYLRNVIANFDNHVKAWIITHPHRDHAGAFNEIYSDLGNVTIDEIYDNGFDYDFIEKNGEPYDDITAMERYHDLLKDNSTLVHLKRGDEFEICKLRFTVVNSFDDEMINNIGKEKDYQNDGSLAFVVTNSKDSFLFLSDVKKDIQKTVKKSIEKYYGDDISYVQCSHHGNWGFSKGFYDKTGADTFFIDCPSKLIESKDYPVYSLALHFKEAGKCIYTYENAPNSVILR